MTPQQQADALIGRLVDGRYRVRARIARGGMATVYVATDLRLERRIALKVMHGHLSDDSMFQSRFIQEARAAARLADPHVVNVYDQGQDGDLAYLVMEYLPGITLRDLLREQRRLSLEHAITIMDAILSGLSAAHRAGIVHRDVKPENVLLAEDGRIKIGDFGLARASSANTATGQQLLGTIAYLAPELVTRGTADARSDIYALGIMLYEMLTGEQPYKGEQPMQIAFQHATESVPRPSIRNANVPESLDELVLWATEKSPDERPIDAQAMLDRLREIEQELDIRPLATPTVATPTPAPSFAESADLTKVMPADGLASTAPTISVESQVDNAARLRHVTQKRHSRGVGLLILVLFLALVAGGAGWWFGSGPGSQVSIPELTEQSYADAAATLIERDLIPVEENIDDLTIPAGQVVRTDPESGTRVDRESSVRVFVSTGPKEIELPALAGKSLGEVEELLRLQHIEVESEIPVYYANMTADHVLGATIIPAEGEGVDCAEGCQVRQGSTARLSRSLGPLPEIVGTEADAAERTLRDLDITPVREEEYDNEVGEGLVIRIGERDGGGRWRPGDQMTIVVSLGPEPIPVPDNLVGKTIREAVRVLQDLGFRVNAGISNQDLPLGGGYWDIYHVCSLNPDDTALPGDTITITPRGPFQSCSQ